MTVFRISKAHGLGNDFLIALASRNPGLDRAFVDAHGSRLGRAWCARHRGIGADGLIFGLASTEPGAGLDMVLVNADGSLAEISGNGIRCLGQAALRDGGERAGRIVIDTAAGRRVLDASATDDPAVDLLRVEMGAVAAGPTLGPLATAQDAIHRGSGDVGNPHIVFHVESLDAVDAARDGSPIDAEVPGGSNVHFVVPNGPDGIRVVHWERGAGVTEACGSGATVSATLAHAWGLVGERVSVAMPGGTATIDVGPVAALTGEACHIAHIEIDDAGITKGGAA